MKVSQSSLDPVFRADLYIVETSILCLLRCRNSGGGGGRGECEKNIKLRAHDMQTFYSGSDHLMENIRTFPEESR